MIKIAKQSIQKILTDYYNEELKKNLWQDWQFQEQYLATFFDFEKQIKNKETENFDLWDDYMEWKACRKMINSLKMKIKEIKNGNFEMA